MATITLEYNPRTKRASALLTQIYESGVFKVKKTTKRMSGFEEALEDIEMGRIYCAKDAKDLIAQCLQK